MDGPHPVGRTPHDRGASRGTHDPEPHLRRWFASLPREEAPAHLRRQVLDAARASWDRRPSFAPHRFTRLFMHPRRLAAVAAALLVALGATWWVLDTRAADRSRDARTTPIVVEDPNLGLFHGIETFDQVGVLADGGGLIADWGR